MSILNTKTEKFQITEQNLIYIPSESYIEGYLKSNKAITLDCSYIGTIFTSKKLVINKTAKVQGDAICENFILEGVMDGNIFCSGHVKFCDDSIFNGKVYTSTFTNTSQNNSDFVIQVPETSTIDNIRVLIEELSTDIGLTSDEILDDVRNLFYKNVFSAKKNPRDIIVNPFTEQILADEKKQKD